MTIHPATTTKITGIEPCGDNKVCITMELVVDVHYLAEVASKMLSAAAKGASTKKKK